jgi:hypothetical protein
VVGLCFERGWLPHMRTPKIPKYLRIESRKVRVTLYVLFATIIADGLLSQFLITRGFGPETNPLLQSLVGTESFLPIKIAGGLLATSFLWIKYNAAPKRVYTVIVVALGVYTLIVYWNLFVYFFVLFTQPV